MAADLIKIFTTSKTFAILTWINTKLRCAEDCGLLWIKQIDGPGLCFEDQYEALQLVKQVVPKCQGCAAKNVGKERKSRNACG